MEFTITWNAEDLLRLFEDNYALRRKTLFWKSHPTPMVGFLCPRDDMEALILERLQTEGFIPAEGTVFTWKTRKELSAQVRVVGNPNAVKVPTPLPSPTLSPQKPGLSMFPPGADYEGMRAAAVADTEDDVLRHPITGKVVGMTKDRSTMVGEELVKKESPVRRRKPRKKPRS